MTPRPRRRLATTGLVLALAGPVAAVALAATVLEHRGRRLRHDGAGAPDVVVVLGAGLRGTALVRMRYVVKSGWKRVANARPTRVYKG